MKAMEHQIFKLSVNHQWEDDNDTGGSRVRSKGPGQWYSNDSKVEIPEYDRKLDRDEFIEWLRTVECAFDYKETSEEHKVKIVAMKLRKYASTWWANTCTKRERLGKTKNQRPAEYSREFEYFLMKCDLLEDDPQTLVRYLGGLDTRVANIVELYPYSSLDDLTLLAHKGLGHIASECPNKKIVTLAEYEGVDNSFTFDTTLDSVMDAESIVEEVVGPGEGACLVVRRALSNAPDQGGNLQREAIFYTRCTITQKICTVIIDGVAALTLLLKPCKTEKDHQSRLQQLFEVLDHEKLNGNLENRRLWISNSSGTTILLILISRNIIAVKIMLVLTPYTTPKRFYYGGGRPFLKMAHFIACHTTYDVVKVANIYFKEVVRLYGIPRTMVSDRDVKFPSHFWITLWRKIGTKLKFSTSSHPQMDGQTEVTNRTLGLLLRALITTNLKQWEDLIPQTKFAYNRAPNKTTGLSPFIVVYGLNPKTPLDLAVLDTSSKFNQEASDRAVDIKALHQHIHDKITKSNELLKYRRDKGRKHILFQPGDLVWVHFRKDQFPAKRRSKLSSKFDDPFRVLARVNDNAYKEVTLEADLGSRGVFVTRSPTWICSARTRFDNSVGCRESLEQGS
uniref:Transposon Ty3-I Gag-Pol polyprotein n=1 Tax=Tanacetum cinerariifolium TaxID=118510 RepID=A0A699GU22_TANCI|nr:transposon Ty3-I Gag-Pol polyprotein [Tanacetum cinerariifolium]